jgi:hypothetical protein
MTFDELLTQAVELLQREGRVSYRALKRRLALDDEYLEDLKAELIDAKRLATDEEGKVLVWLGASPVPGSEFRVPSSTQSLDAPRAEAERRQLTVISAMACWSTSAILLHTKTMRPAPCGQDSALLRPYSNYRFRTSGYPIYYRFELAFTQG